MKRTIRPRRAFFLRRGRFRDRREESTDGEGWPGKSLERRRKRMPGRKKQVGYDRERFEPAVRCSICTGEQTAGFRDRQTGNFREVSVIRSERDLLLFCRRYGVEEPVRKLY